MASQSELLVGDAGVQQPTADGLSGAAGAHLQVPATSEGERDSQAAVMGLKYGPGTQVLFPAQLPSQVRSTLPDLPAREPLLFRRRAGPCQVQQLASHSLPATAAACSSLHGLHGRCCAIVPDLPLPHPAAGLHGLKGWHCMPW